MTTTPSQPDEVAGRPRHRRPGAPYKLAHIVFKTPRPQQMIHWYTLVLDAAVVFENERLAFLSYDDEHHRIALVKMPAALKVPASVWKWHRKVFGVDHIAFTYPDLPDLTAAYERLSRNDIHPVWCINHGPTTSIYYHDPDGNRIELQVDNFDDAALEAWMAGDDFKDNSIGVEFDPRELIRHLEAGVPRDELVKRGSAPPPGRAPKAGLRAINWKTL